jgi:hypothetical protein
MLEEALILSPAANCSVRLSRWLAMILNHAENYALRQW